MRTIFLAALGACVVLASCAQGTVRDFGSGEGGQGGDDDAGNGASSSNSSSSGLAASGSSTGTGGQGGLGGQGGQAGQGAGGQGGQAGQGGQGGQGGSLAVCGDGKVEGAESCDDANLKAGDGCSACAAEPGWMCVGSPSACSTICGDGIIVGAEMCDDGNLVNGDGCSSGCQAEGMGPCSTYITLSEPDRNVTFNDGDGGVEICDEVIGPNWFRFMGAAGVQMPTSSPPEYACGTDAPGWLNGSYPLVADGIVDRTVCFNWAGNTCNWSAAIQILNCNGYYVFNFPNTPVCHLRYCGTN